MAGTGELRILNLFSLGAPHNADASLVEQVYGQGYDSEGKHVGRGGDDGGNDEYDHDGVPAVFPHERLGENTQAGKQPA